eukprot:gene6276-6515_t
MVGRGFLFLLPQQCFDDAECLGSATEADAGTDTGDFPGETAEPTLRQAAAAHGWNESGATCITCGIGINSQGFNSPAEQRQHFKTDWHRYNLRRRLDKKPALSEADFAKLIQDNEDDVSQGGGSSSSRAKAGGKQSTKDATGKYARSAGSRLRRYNEAALQRDISQLLRDWSRLIMASQIVFLSAPGKKAGETAAFKDHPRATATGLEEAALIKAAKAGDADRVTRLLDNGHDPTVRDARGRSPYQLAANKEVGWVKGGGSLGWEG